MRVTLQFYVFYTPFLADTTFLLAATVCVYYKHIGLDNIQCGNKVHHSATGIDIGIFHVSDALDHKQALLLGIDGLAVLVTQIGLIGAYAYIQIAVLSRLTEELYMAAVQQIVATAYKYLLSIVHLDMGYWLTAMGRELKA